MSLKNKSSVMRSVFRALKKSVRLDIAVIVDVGKKCELERNGTSLIVGNLVS
jgi:hypothetical protein